MLSSMLQPLLKEAAKTEITPRYHHNQARMKADGSLVTEADLAVQNRVAALLAERWPEIPLLGEEMGQEAQRGVLETGRFWCLDPLDGTTNFSSGLPYFCISIALIEGGRVVSGVVYDPVRDECFRADEGQGAWLNDERLEFAASPASLRESVAIVDLKRLGPDLVMRLARSSPYRSQRNFGAVALEWCWMAAGRASLYLHGSQKLWDYAAGTLILGEAGGRSALFDGLEGAPSEGLTLVPKAAIGAASPGLFREWEQWVRGGAAARTAP